MRVLRQPDRRSCGAAVLVRARMWREPGYAASVPDQAAFARETLALHRRVTRPLDGRGRPQVPWPRALGTPPWAVARHLSGASGGRPSYRTRPVLPWRRHSAWRDLVSAVGAGHPVPVYVGNRWLPRHVVLVTAGRDGSVTVYEPSAGTVVQRSAADFTAGRLRLGGWDVPWFVVTPA